MFNQKYLITSIPILKSVSDLRLFLGHSPVRDPLTAVSRRSSLNSLYFLPDPNQI